MSESVAKDVNRYAAPWKKVRVLPNSTDPSRWNAASRSKHRSSTRRSLGWEENDLVFVFSSQGHHRRKGFEIAVKAVSLLRPLGNARLLVLGGVPKTLERLRDELARTVPDFHEFTHFAGMVSDPLPWLAGADALLFPSYSEAFSLVEIEAAALGLRLYLTPHHGSEMLLGPDIPSNGRMIPWNAEGIAEILRADLGAGILTPGASHLGLALPHDQFANQFIEILTSPKLQPTAAIDPP